MLRDKVEDKLNFIPLKGIYLSDDRIRPDRIFKRLKAGKRCRYLYFIVLSKRSGCLFEIYTDKEFFLPIYENKSFEVAGIAKGKRRMLSLLERMISDIYQKTNTIDVDNFFHT